MRPQPTSLHVLAIRQRPAYDLIDAFVGELIKVGPREVFTSPVLSFIQNEPIANWLIRIDTFSTQWTFLAFAPWQWSGARPIGPTRVYSRADLVGGPPMQSSRNENFARSVWILFCYGQVPAVLATFVLIFGVALIYKSSITDLGWHIGTALGGIVVSFVAYWCSSNQYKKGATTLLFIALALTLWYLYLLVQSTHGARSPFVHLYLYLPAVVLMVAKRNRWAEWAATVGVMGCYCSTYRAALSWQAWKQFEDDGYTYWLDPTLVALLLLLLIAVNWKMEKLIREDTHTNDGAPVYRS